ncbi:MAG: hypothetical protein VYC97_05450, partial [SAR324 cluster bacterium]|nr:hypothetical protein [SAR324 cluster bacterium]
PACHSARSRRRSRRIHPPKNNPFIPGEGDCRRWWERAIEEHFLPPLIRPGGELFPGRRLFLAKRDSGFCNYGQALRAE